VAHLTCTMQMTIVEGEGSGRSGGKFVALTIVNHIDLAVSSGVRATGENTHNICRNRHSIALTTNMRMHHVDSPSRGVEHSQQVDSEYDLKSRAIHVPIPWFRRSGCKRSEIALKPI
jgi:hypothetical protein